LGPRPAAGRCCSDRWLFYSGAAPETLAHESETPVKDREHELHRRRRGRNYAVLGVLVAFAALMFAVTIAKMGSHAGNPWG